MYVEMYSTTNDDSRPQYNNSSAGQEDLGEWKGAS